tara:strand:+ start:579 stop:1031 length:453 start_codon:yes stop_codon:yes gene_type:complete
MINSINHTRYTALKKASYRFLIVGLVILGVAIILNVISAIELVINSRQIMGWGIVGSLWAVIHNSFFTENLAYLITPLLFGILSCACALLARLEQAVPYLPTPDYGEPRSAAQSSGINETYRSVLICQNCGTTFDPGQNFCRECGNPKNQ